MNLLFVLARHEQTKFFLRHILSTINSYLPFKSLYNLLFLFLPMLSASRVKNDNLMFAIIVTLKIANGAEHSVSLWYPAVASFSSANGVGEFGVDKFMSAFRAAEIKKFVTNPSNYRRLVQIKIGTAL
jgi:hypothetical protein